MLSCKELAHQHASDYLDGQLPPRARLAVSLHLAVCVHCRRFMKQLRVVAALLRVDRKSAAEESAEAEIQSVATRLHRLHSEKK